jgi:two-component system NarL family response regulator
MHDRSKDMITVAIIEDNINTLNYLEALLSGSGCLKVIGTYKSGREALESLPQSLPDVLLTDLNLPDLSGIEVIRSVSERHDQVDILVLTMHDEKDYILPALKAGASGYILKGTGPAEIIESVIEIKRGGAPMSPKIARYVLNELKSKNAGYSDSLLSDREREVLKGIANSYSEKILAEKLVLSQHTVHAHIKNIYKKLQANSRTEALNKAKSIGYL